MATTTKVRSAQDSKFENIVVGKFSANEDFDQHVSGVVLATQRTKGTFSVNRFAIAQFLASAATVSAETSGKLMAKLGLLLFQDDKNMEITLTRAEVIELRDVLQVRVAHCEHERDARSDKFNPDTYIGQKFLLLDIREWLMITAIGDFNPEKEPQQEKHPSEMTDQEYSEYVARTNKDVYDMFYGYSEHKYQYSTQLACSLYDEMFKECERTGLIFHKLCDAFDIANPHPMA